MTRHVNRAALTVAQDLARMALATKGFRRQYLWILAKNELRRAYKLEVV